MNFHPDEQSFLDSLYKLFKADTTKEKVAALRTKWFKEPIYVAGDQVLDDEAELKVLEFHILNDLTTKF